MDFVTFVSKAVEFLGASDSAFFVLYAAATCVLTQFAKKLFVNKAKVDVLHKFDLAPLLPFVFATVFAVVDIFAVQHVCDWNFSVVLRVILSALAIGAMASTIYRFAKACSGQSLNNLMKDDVFAVFYTQLLYFGDVRQQISDKKLSMKEFVERVRLLAADAQEIYKQDDSIDSKRCRLARLLGGIIDDKSIETCVNVLNQALAKLIANN